MCIYTVAALIVVAGVGAVGDVGWRCKGTRIANHVSQIHVKTILTFSSCENAKPSGTDPAGAV